MKYFAISLIILVSVVACVPVIKKDYHIVFDTLEADPSSVHSNAYVLNKGTYSIHFIMHKENLTFYLYSLDRFGQPVNLSGQSNEKMEYNKHGTSINDAPCGIFSQQPFPESNAPSNLNKEAISFDWYLWRPHCDFGKVKGEKLSIKLTTKNKKGEILGIDEIAFFIKFRGFKIMIDSI